MIHFSFFIFSYFQLEDTAKLVQYLGFILNFKRNAYRENTLASGNYKVVFLLFSPLLLLKNLSPDAYSKWEWGSQ